jgi:hypothetical protein
MKKSVLITAGLLGLALIAFSACGELPANKSVPDDIQKVSIPIFQNQTGTPNLENDLTRKVVQDFAADGRVQVEAKDHAQAELRGIIRRYDRIVLTRDANQVPQQYKLQLVVDIDFVNMKDGKDAMLWTTRPLFSLTPGVELTREDDDSTNVRSLKEYTNYYVLNVAGVPPEDEPAALDRLLNQMSQRVVRRTLDGF